MSALVTADAVGQLRVRRAAAGDREQLTRMFGRCSGRTRYERFHGYVNMFPQRYLTEALSGSPIHYALVALAPPAVDTDRDADGPGTDIVALASCRAIAEGVAELGLLVEDRWQQHGVGGHLLRELIGYADSVGMRALKAQILSEQSWIINVLRSYGTCRTARVPYDILDVTLRLPHTAPPRS
jgi:GNAT superfamily N-acetyltransferase